MRREHWILIGLVAITALVYGQVVTFDFADFDDPNYVIRNPQVTGGLTVPNVIWAFTTGYEANWHPVTWISLMLDATIFGSGPAGFHLTNLVLHVLNTLLLFWILRSATRRDGPSALVAALFALHPLHVESVAWITERKDVLSLFWGLLAMWAYLEYCRRGRLRLYLIAAVCLALGLMAKPLVVTLPFVLLLLDFWPLGRVAGPRALMRIVLEKIPLLALVAAAGLVTYLAQSRYGAVTDEIAVPLDLRLANAVVSYVRYLARTVWPANLSILYPHPNMAGGTPWAAWQVTGAALVLLGISWLVYRYRRYQFLPVGWSWYLGTLVPMIGVVQVGSQAMADRYTYLPLIGLFIAVAWTGDTLMQLRAAPLDQKRGRKADNGPGRPIKAAMSGAAIIIMLLCAVVSWQQVRVWRNPLTLGFHAIQAGPTGPKIYYNLGLALSQAGRNEEAIPHYDAAIRLKPDHARAYNNRGRALHEVGRLTEAIESMRRALEIDPDLELAYANLSAALADAGRWDEAIAARREAVRRDPQSAVGHYNLGALLARTGRLEEAVGQFRRALEIDPGFMDARRSLERLQSALRDANTGEGP